MQSFGFRGYLSMPETPEMDSPSLYVYEYTLFGNNVLKIGVFVCNDYIKMMVPLCTNMVMAPLNMRRVYSDL